MRLWIPLFLLALIVACTPVEKYQTHNFRENLGRASSADITITMNTETTSIAALPPEETIRLFEADIDYFGEIEYTVSGSTNKIINLTEITENKTYVGEKELFWAISLNRQLPLDLAFRVDGGKINANLVDLNVEGVDLKVNMGTADVRLPPSEEEIDMHVLLDSGALTLAIPNDVTLDIQGITLDDGTVTMTVGENVSFVADIFIRKGDIAFDVAGRSAVQINIVAVGSGTVSLPSDYQRRVVEDMDTQESDTQTNPRSANAEGVETGVWESPDFATSERGIIINITMERGKVIIR